MIIPVISTYSGHGNSPKSLRDCVGYGKTEKKCIADIKMSTHSASKLTRILGQVDFSMLFWGIKRSMLKGVDTVLWVLSCFENNVSRYGVDVLKVTLPLHDVNCDLWLTPHSLYKYIYPPNIATGWSLLHCRYHNTHAVKGMYESINDNFKVRM